MRVKNINSTIISKFDHPAVALFRSIELKAISELVKKIEFTGKSLDIGCGDGDITAMIFDRAFDYGLDNGEVDAYKTAVTNKRYSKFLFESAENMSLRDNTINFAFCNSVIEHIPNNDLVLKEVSRVLKKDGLFLFTAPSDQFTLFVRDSGNLKFLPGFMRSSYASFRNKMLNHYHLYSKEIWAKKLEQVGLDVIKHAYYISPEAIQLWDRLALDVRLKELFFENYNSKSLLSKYLAQIEYLFNKASVSKETGACVFVLARKVK